MTKLYNLAKMNTTTAGTGTITLGSAIPGFLTFAEAGVQDGDIVSYGIINGSDREVGTGTYTASGTTLTRSVTNSTNANSLLSLTGTSTVFITVLSSDISQLANRPYAYVRDEKVQNTNGGTFTAGAWTPRELNTIVSDDSNIMSLSANQITLSAGTYICRIRCPAYDVNAHQARLQNVTSATTLCLSSTGFSNSTAYAFNDVFIVGKFTVAAGQILEVQHKCATTSSGTYGYGQAANLDAEIYTEAEFWKVDSNIAINTSVINQPYVHIRDEKAQNTGGGTFTSGAWQIRDLNTKVSDTENIATLSSNKITLPAGTYMCNIKCPAGQVDNHQARLYNVTDASVILIGQGAYSAAGANAVTTSQITGKFTIAAPKELRVEHRCQTTYATYGFGATPNFTTEIYTEAEFWKLDTGSATYKEYEIDYVERTTTGSTVATSAATATSFITGNSKTYDGNTRIKIEYWCQNAVPSTGNWAIANLYEDSTNLGRIGQTGVGTSAGDQGGATFRTPTAGSHTYSIRIWTTGGTSTFYAAAADDALPAYMRITRA